jgi:hypothetical protein
MRVLGRRVGACLRNLRKKGLVTLTRSVDGIGLWAIIA